MNDTLISYQKEGRSDDATDNLLKFTANGFAHRRPDGVNVVPLPALSI